MLKILDNQLKTTKFLAGNDLSVADVVIAVHLRYLFSLVIDEVTRNQVPNATKWFVNLMEHPVNVAYFGRTWLCQKEFVPDFEFMKAREEEKKK